MNDAARGQVTAHDMEAACARSVRTSVSVCLECGTPIPAELTDVSRLDLLILADRPLRYGTLLNLAIYHDLVTSIACTRAVVHYCRATHRGWQIGAFLTQPLHGRLSVQTWDDVRSQLRYECDWKAWVLWDQDGQLDPVSITCYSINGMRIEGQRAVTPGSEFSLFGSSGYRGQSVLTGRIEWCRRVDDRFVAGCFVPGQRGRDLPRLFGNLTAVHMDAAAPPQFAAGDDVAELPGFQAIVTEQFDPPERPQPAAHRTRSGGAGSGNAASGNAAGSHAQSR